MTQGWRPQISQIPRMELIRSRPSSVPSVSSVVQISVEQGMPPRRKQNGEDARGVFTVLKTSVGKLSALFAALRAGVAAGEFLNAPGGIDELLLAGEKRMARRADADPDVALGRAGVIDFAARATDRGLEILRMNICFHGSKKGVGR